MLSQLRVDELLAALGAKTPAPASGAATALTAALAASLAELSARYGGDEDGAERAHALAAELVRLGDEDAARSSYGADTYQRLVELKGSYDPTNVFRLNQNIVPAP